MIYNKNQIQLSHHLSSFFKGRSRPKRGRARHPKGRFHRVIQIFKFITYNKTQNKYFLKLHIQKQYTIPFNTIIIQKQNIKLIRSINLQVLIQETMDHFGQPTHGEYNTFNQNSPQQQYTSKTTDLYGAARVAFIRKVYTILSIQLMITVIMTAFSMLSRSYFLFQIQNIWLMWTALVVTIGIEIYVFCCNGARTSPANMITLGIFTLCQGYIVSFISSVTGQQQGSGTVLLAAFLTMVVVIACTLYACYTQEDYTTSSLIVIILSVILLILFIVTMFTDSPLIKNIYCGVGVFLFSIYLIIDTQMIMGGKSVELTVDQYALAALLLYIDIIQIFLYILQLLSNNND